MLSFLPTELHVEKGNSHVERLWIARGSGAPMVLAVGALRHFQLKI